MVLNAVIATNVDASLSIKGEINSKLKLQIPPSHNEAGIGYMMQLFVACFISVVNLQFWLVRRRASLHLVCIVLITQSVNHLASLCFLDSSTLRAHLSDRSFHCSAVSCLCQFLLSSLSLELHGRYNIHSTSAGNQLQCSELNPHSKI